MCEWWIELNGWEHVCEWWIELNEWEHVEREKRRDGWEGSGGGGVRQKQLGNLAFHDRCVLCGAGV